LTLRTQRRKLANEQKRLEHLVDRELQVSCFLAAVTKALRHLQRCDPQRSPQHPSFECAQARGWAAVVQVARELVAQRQKDRALLALKRRKLHEQQLEKLVSEETLQLRGLAETCCASFTYSVNTCKHVCCAGRL
jgi:hypothetical protein